MEIKRELAGDVMLDDGLMHVHRAFRASGRTAGEVQESHVFGTCRHDLKRIRCCCRGGGQIGRGPRRIA
jgi:hypothetical protein